MKTSLIDKILREIAPAKAVSRLENKAYFDVMAGGYSAVSDSRYRTHRAYNRAFHGTEDQVLGKYDRNRLRLECRDLWRNNEVVRAIVDRFTEYAVWNGLYPQAQTTDKNWNKQAEAWWREIYVPTADYRQIQGVDLITLQDFAISHRILDGDLGYVFMDNGQLMPVEGVRICTPSKYDNDKNVTDGVRRAKSGLVVGYYICPRADSGSIDREKYQYLKSENFVHCMKPGRIDQFRGVPDLAPAVNKLRDYDETDEAVVNKVKADAMQWAKRKTESGLPNMRARGAYTKTDENSKDPQRVEKLENLRIMHMKPNEDLLAFESKTPNREYVSYLQHELKVIAACLGISYEIVLLIFTDGSFSSQRAALIHNRHHFMTWHEWVAKTMMRRVWNWRIAKAIKAATLPPAPTDPETGASQWWRVAWTIPNFDWVDPQKQAAAESQRYELGSTSLKSIVASTGRERSDVFGEKGDDIQNAIETAKEINTKHPGANVTWRDIITTKGGAAPAAQQDTTRQDTPGPTSTTPQAPPPSDQEESETP